MALLLGTEGSPLQHRILQARLPEPAASLPPNTGACAHVHTHTPSQVLDLPPAHYSKLEPSKTTRMLRKYIELHPNMCRKGGGKEEEWRGRSGKVKGKRKRGERRKRLGGREGGEGGGEEAARKRKSIIFISILSLLPQTFINSSQEARTLRAFPTSMLCFILNSVSLIDLEVL